MGRFTSPDDFLNDTHVSDPQSWNLYVYVRNNPLHLIDPTGQEIETENGKVKFDKNGKSISVEMAKGSRTVTVNDKTEKRTISVTGGFNEGTIYSKNNGKTTAIQAYQSTGALTVTEKNEKGETTFTGTVGEFEQYSGITDFNGANNTSNCHGTTFANGEVWIQNDQVENLMTAEGYDVGSPSSTATAGAVGIFSLDGTLANTRHSIGVIAPSEPQVGRAGYLQEASLPLVESKSGIYPRQVTTPTQSWTNTDPSRNNHVLLYYTKIATK